MQIERLATGVLLSFALAPVLSCQHSEMRYLEREVSVKEVVGIWQMNPDSVADLRDVGYGEPIDPSKHRITIRQDGSCHFSTFVGAGAGPMFNLLDADCQWSLGTVGHQALLVEVHGQQPSRPYYYFDETSNGALVLWIFLDDPDQWDYVEYLRVNGAAGEELGD